MLLALAFPYALNSPIDASPSPMVLGFAWPIAGSGILFGVTPAWIASRANPVDALRGGMRSILAVRRCCSGRWW